MSRFPQRLPAAIARMDQLPALSESRNTLLSVVQEHLPSEEEMVAAIESDIALLVGVLRLANAAPGTRRPTIWSVPEAVRALRPNDIEALARRVPVFDFFQRVRGWAIAPEQFRLHAVMTQRAAQRLGRVVDHPDPDRLAVAALLHDIGKLVMMEAFDGYPRNVLAVARTPEECVREERRQFGPDHQMAGSMLLLRWGLPDRLAEIVGSHHEQTDDRDANLIRLADALAHYTQGWPVSPRELRGAARDAGLPAEQLRTLMYELPQANERRRFREVEPSPLSRRQTQVLRELAKGSSYKEIGSDLHLSSSTVRSHLHNSYKTLGVADRARAVLTATERGWI